MNMLQLRALWVLGLLSPEELPKIGVEGLEDGHDSNALIQLAGLTPNEIGKAGLLFDQALQELGVATLLPVDALKMFASLISTQILQGELSPGQGATKIWDATIHVNDPNFTGLDEFIYAASELEDRPEDANFFNQEIVKAAKNWISKEQQNL